MGGHLNANTTVLGNLLENSVYGYRSEGRLASFVSSFATGSVRALGSEQVVIQAERFGGVSDIEFYGFFGSIVNGYIAESSVLAGVGGLLFQNLERIFECQVVSNQVTKFEVE